MSYSIPKLTEETVVRAFGYLFLSLQSLQVLPRLTTNFPTSPCKVLPGITSHHSSLQVLCLLSGHQTVTY